MFDCVFKLCEKTKNTQTYKEMKEDGYKRHMELQIQQRKIFRFYRQMIDEKGVELEEGDKVLVKQGSCI